LILQLAQIGPVTPSENRRTCAVADPASRPRVIRYRWAAAGSRLLALGQRSRRSGARLKSY
jgi:hypothetical protein